MNEIFTVLGAGTWGSVMANHIDHAGHKVNIWHYKDQFAAEFDRTRTHPHLNGFILAEGIAVSSDLPGAVADSAYIMVAVPSQKVREVIGQLRGGLDGKSIANLSKGIEQHTLKRMSEVICEAGEIPAQRVASIYGPSHAEEVMNGIPTTLVTASTDMDYARTLQQLLSTSDLRVYANSDIIGVELGGSVKNVIAIAVGISEGIGFGDNTVAALVTRGLAEVTRLGIAMGANISTFAGLSGIGDLVVTAYSRHSRNRRLGLAIGNGQSAEESMQEMGMVAEGIYTAQSVIGLADKLGVEMPICREIHHILFDGKDPKKAITALMTRDLRDETPH